MFDAIVEAPGIIGNKRSYNDPIDFFNTLKVFISEAQEKDTIKFMLTNFKEGNVERTKKLDNRWTYEKGKKALLIIFKAIDRPITVKKLMLKIDLPERTTYWYLMKMQKEKLVKSIKSPEGKAWMIGRHSYY
jgi:hypothetical protein